MRKSKTFSNRPRWQASPWTRALGFASLLWIHGHSLELTGKIVDTSGTAISQAKIWLLADTTQSVVSGSDGTFHLAATVSVFQPLGKPTGHGPISLQSNRGGLVLQSPQAATVNLSLNAMTGQKVWEAKSLPLNAGANPLESLIHRPIPAGVYVLRLHGDGWSLTAHLRKSGGFAVNSVSQTSDAKGSPPCCTPLPPTVIRALPTPWEIIPSPSPTTSPRMWPSPIWCTAIIKSNCKSTGGKWINSWRCPTPAASAWDISIPTVCRWLPSPRITPCAIIFSTPPSGDPF